MKVRALLACTALAIQGCLLPRSVAVRPSQGGGLYRMTFRNADSGAPALGFGYSIETGRLPLIAMLGTSYSGGPLDLQGSTEWTLENDPSGTWSVRLEPPHRGAGSRVQQSYSFDLNRLFRQSGRRWPAKFRLSDERSGRWELIAERIGAARY